MSKCINRTSLRLAREKPDESGGDSPAALKIVIGHPSTSVKGRPVSWTHKTLIEKEKQVAKRAQVDRNNVSIHIGHAKHACPNLTSTSRRDETCSDPRCDS